MKQNLLNSVGITWTRRSVSAALAALVAVGVGSGPALAQSWDDVVAAAKEEGELLLYSTRSDADNTRVINAFMEKFPEIDAKSVRLVGGQMIARVDQELAAGALAADVLLHSERQWTDAKAKAGELWIPDGPAAKLWEGSARPIDEGVVVVTAEPWVIGYNTDMVDTPPTDWDSLLDDKSFVELVGTNEVSGLTVTIWYDFIENKKPGYWEKFAELEPRVYPNSAPLTAGLSSGEIAWSPYSLASTMKPLIEKGAPIAWVVADSGTWALEREAMVHKSAPRPNAAKVFMNFLMSEDGQNAWNGNGKGFSFAPGVTVKDGLDVDTSKIERVDYLAYSADDLKAWQAKADELFRR